eukprot:12783601-Alexandrium_andersonii.AAC.1
MRDSATPARLADAQRGPARRGRSWPSPRCSHRGSSPPSARPAAESSRPARRARCRWSERSAWGSGQRSWPDRRSHRFPSPPRL